MRHLTVVTMVTAMLASAALVSAEEIKSGLQAGDFIGAFNVTKTAGAADDGVDVDKNLCYRCKNGGRPQVMIFTRSTDEKVVKLVQKLDQALTDNSGKQLRAFVNVLGESRPAATDESKALAATSKVKNVPFVVPDEFENGPADYGINAKADVTVILATGGQVKANRAFGAAKDVDVDAVIGDLQKILN